jgi:hypothetical protein
MIMIDGDGRCCRRRRGEEEGEEGEG